MTYLSLENSSYILDTNFDTNTRFLDLIEGQRENTYLLFPHRNAVEASKTMGATDTPIQVILIDATWNAAGAIFNNSLLLKSLNKIKFSSPPKSQFKIRTQPANHFVSTIEASDYLLRKLGEDTNGLLNPFHYMVDRQIEHQISNNPSHYRKWEH